jgi:hypothetical protein
VTGPIAPSRVLMPGRPPVELPVGTPMTFGRGAPAKPVDLEVSANPRVSRRAGTVEATQYGVLLTNTGSNPLFVREGKNAQETPVRSGQTLLLMPGTSRITFAGVADFFEVLVLGTASHNLVDEATVDEATSEKTAPAWALNKDTAYYWCLVALCEPTLRNPAEPWIPTSQQIANRLRAARVLPGERTGDWVDRRLDDVREKLPIGEKAWSADRARQAGRTTQQQAMRRAESGAPRRSARKEQLVEFAVSYGLVTLDDVIQLFGS